uniref:Putative secreted protein n=1 Tax=Anopheles darlingi TaxID=43151 RepID=A0A2M4D039_ANODA
MAAARSSRALLGYALGSLVGFAANRPGPRHPRYAYRRWDRPAVGRDRIAYPRTGHRGLQHFHPGSDKRPLVRAQEYGATDYAVRRHASRNLPRGMSGPATATPAHKALIAFLHSTVRLHGEGIRNTA